MRVYTHYNSIEGTDSGYRWRTLLQFGSSWNIIGSIVMMNPGNANFKHADHQPETDKTILDNLRRFDNEDSIDENWYEFGSDPTLDLVNEMFTERARANHQGELDGIVQVFNLFYLKNPNLGKGIEMNQKLNMESINDRIFADDIKNLKAPVYLGFGQLSQNSQFKKKAECFFNKAVNELGVRYLDPDFERNSFMHPRRLMRFMKSKPEGKLLKLQFYHNAIASEAITNAMKEDFMMITLRDTLIEKTNHNWGLYQGWDLVTTFNEKNNKIGIESWFGRKGKENDNWFHIFITVWNKQCFVPYEDALRQRFPDSQIDDMGLKNRLYLHLPIVQSNDINKIHEALLMYFNSLKEIVKSLTE